MKKLTFQAPITTAADFSFSLKISLGISCGSSIYMKCQDIFSMKKYKAEDQGGP